MQQLQSFWQHSVAALVMSQIQKLHRPSFILGLTNGLVWIGVCASAMAQSSPDSRGSDFIRQPIRSNFPPSSRAESPLPETGQLEWQSSQAPAEAGLLVKSTQTTTPNSGHTLKWKPVGKKSVQRRILTSKATPASANATQASLQRVAVQPHPIRQPTRKNTVTQPQPIEQVRFTPPPSFRNSEVPHVPPASPIAPNTASESDKVVRQRGRKLVQYHSQPWVAEPQSESAGAIPKLNLVSRQLPQPEKREERRHAERTISRLEPLPGWQAVGAEVSQRIARSESLMQRNAFFSAREEASGAMNYLAHILDSGNNTLRSHSALQAAQTAIQEAENFASGSAQLDQEGIRLLISSHTTPVLKDADAQTLVPLTAAQHYHKFAQEKLVEASQGHPWCSEVLYSLGRSFQAQSETAADSGILLREKSLLYYRAALEIAPGNTLAANQLGYMLLGMDRAQEARSVLIQSIQATPTRPAIQNLAEAAHRLGDQQVLNWIAGYLQQNTTLNSTQKRAPTVTQVSPDAFIALSPYNSGPSRR